MDANQLAEALARAVEAAKPPAEYCLLATQDHWWTVCMTKAEWSGWMQAIGSMAALALALWLPYHQKKKAVDEAIALAKHCIVSQCALLTSIGLSTKKGGFRVATFASKDSIASILRLYTQVATPILPSNVLIPWTHAQGLAGRLSELVNTVEHREVPDESVEQSIAILRETSLAFLAEFTEASKNKKIPA